MGLSQWEFSLRSGINIGTLRNWEQARNQPQIEIFARLICALGPRSRPLLERLGIATTATTDAMPSNQRSVKPIKPRREGGNIEKVRVR